MKITKKDIEILVNEILAYLAKNEMDNDVCIYFNNRRIVTGTSWDDKKKELIPYKKVEENVNPLDYFKYANPKHILSMSFEGPLYHLLNDGDDRQEEFLAIFEKFGLYYELGNAWNLSAYPSDDAYDGIEYTCYERPQEPERIHLHKDGVPVELQNIMQAWYELSSEVGDIGPCVLGAGFYFTYKEKPYFMCSCSPWQGCISWEKNNSIIKTMLETIGATHIRYEQGVMD